MPNPTPSQARHTAGDWRVVPMDDARNCNDIYAGDVRVASYVMDCDAPIVAAAPHMAARVAVLEDALRTIDTMPVDGCSPSVIESMLRQAKSLAYAALASPPAQEAKP